MLQINDLTITMIKDMRTLLKDFSFVLGRNDKAALIGEEGNGKSTLLKLIYDPELIEGYAEYSGSISAAGEIIGYLAQELTAEQRALTINEFFARVPSCDPPSPKELTGIAAQLGLPADIFCSRQTVDSLSGGETVKLQLAAILMRRPTLLLLDEPSNDIDIETLEWLESFIKGCGLPVMYVSHDETLLENTANVIIHTELVRKKTMPRCTVAKMPYRQYIEERISRLGHQEQVARKERDEYDKQQEKLRRIAQKVEHDQNAVSRGDPHGGALLKKKMKAVKSQTKRFEKQKESMTQIPDVEDAIMLRFAEDVRLPAGKTALSLELPELRAGGRTLSRNIRLNIAGTEHICIVGRNGVGKTTLMKLIADELLPRRDIKAGYMPQNYADTLDMQKTPVEYLNRSGHREEATKIRSYLGSVRYTTDEMEHRISELSGGQKAKLMLIGMILDGCNVLILDEPTRNFSPLSSPVIRQVLRSFGGCIISVSHDRKYISEVADKVYELTTEGLNVK